MKKILVLLAGAAIIGGTATACAQINGDASGIAKNIVNTYFGNADNNEACAKFTGTETDVVGDKTVTLATKDACENKFAENKGKYNVSIASVFVGRDDKDAYNLGLVFKTTEKEGDKNTVTYDAFIYFNAGSLSNPTKIEWTRR